MSSFEELYLAANPDVANAVRDGQFESGMQHYLMFGKREERALVPIQSRARELTEKVAREKARKLETIAPLLRTDMPCVTSPLCFDFLNAELRAQFDIIDTDIVSGNGYDQHVLDLIARHPNGLILDCGSGNRSTYYDNVVNFEIAAFDSTDVRGVGEVLPFVDGAFDAVISLAVLEHVTDPFRCAAEIKRVLKPGGELICCAAFLQPYHGYPHHYYNMTHHGLRNLFANEIDIDRIDVYDSVRPIWSLNWIIQSWAEGLKGQTREDFLNMRLEEFLVPPAKFLGAPFVTELPVAKNLELASACVLFGKKQL
ncbi:methyltransferase domain-containing protein [Pseudolysobacter antarcticus]|uniref:Methyltransferase domain-containing protein n=1 Tax=Pseudolysobacter antarcticus TaxID=2511995 RepID=A0A411HMZ0_9GAMM|nr:class I SAM-dependent methyltransferase [Pseudolysobacter antarcticus]QBB71848.1 methyltransferase domain-containing protein [Pseudolysobacter antarcticus]